MTTIARRLDVLEQRQELLLRALRGEWTGTRLGSFEKAWNSIDPETPAPGWVSEGEEQARMEVAHA